LNKTTFIYALTCPNTGEVRYIGKSDNPQKRYRIHVHNYFNKDSYKARWIRSLQRDNTKPGLMILEEVMVSEWIEAEKRWIAHYRSIGAKLTNITEGGQGGATNKGKKSKPIIKVIDPPVEQAPVVFSNFTLLEVAQKRNVSIITVRKWVQRKQLKAIKRAGAWFVDPADLAKFKPAKRGRKAKDNQ
jgi:hypothetical protein